MLDIYLILIAQNHCEFKNSCHNIISENQHTKKLVFIQFGITIISNVNAHFFLFL